MGRQYLFIISPKNKAVCCSEQWKCVIVSVNGKIKKLFMLVWETDMSSQSQTKRKFLSDVGNDSFNLFQRLVHVSIKI